MYFLVSVTWNCFCISVITSFSPIEPNTFPPFVGKWNFRVAPLSFDAIWCESPSSSLLWDSFFWVLFFRFFSISGVSLLTNPFGIRKFLAYASDTSFISPGFPAWAICSRKTTFMNCVGFYILEVQITLTLGRLMILLRSPLQVIPPPFLL